MAQYVFLAALSYAMQRISASLAEPALNTPLQDEKPVTSGTRGSFIPLSWGPNSHGPVIGWVGDRVVEVDDSDAGGKGTTTTGGTASSKTYYESALHWIGEGMYDRMDAITYNGSVVFDTPISRATTPSGSTFDIESENFSCTMHIYWGEYDQPVNAQLGLNTRIGITSRWPGKCYVYIEKARLGGFPQWGAMEYHMHRNANGSALINSPKEVDNALGPALGAVLHEIVRVENSPSPDTAFFKILDDFEDEFNDAGFVSVTEQPRVSNNRIFEVSSAVFNPADAVLVYDQTNLIPEITSYTNYTTFPELSTFIFSGPAVGGLPKAGTFTVDDWILGPFAFLSEISADIGTFTDFQSVRWYIRGVLNNDLGTRFIVGLRNLTQPGLEHSVELRVQNWSSLVTLQSTSGGAQASLTLLASGWYQIDLTYAVTDLPGDTEVGDTRELFIQSNCAKVTAGCEQDAYVLVDAGNLHIGTTAVTTVEPLAFMVGTEGFIQAYERGGIGSQAGVNPAHILYDMLFSKGRRGASRDIEQFDIPSLEALGELWSVDNEGIRAAIMLSKGLEYQAAVAKMMQDLAFFIGWDPTIGKYKFMPMRAEVTSEVPAKITQYPLPKTDSILRAGSIDKLGFVFIDKDKNYRQNGFPVADNGISRQKGFAKVDIAELFIARDIETAVFTSKFRSKLSQSSLTPVTLFVGREGRNIFPGQVWTFEKAPELGSVRILSTTWKEDTSKYQIKGFIDPFNKPVEEIAFAANNISAKRSNTVVPAELDAAARLLFVGDSIVPLRIRSDKRGSTYQVLVSYDSISYKVISTISGYNTGGTLNEAMVGTTDFIVTGPEITPQGPDFLDIIESYVESLAERGAQWLIINDEIMYCGSYTLNPDGTVVLKNIYRAQLGTTAQVHNIGDQLYLADVAKLIRLRQDLVDDSVEFSYKIAPTHLSLALIPEVIVPLP